MPITESANDSITSSFLALASPFSFCSCHAVIVARSSGSVRIAFKPLSLATHSAISASSEVATSMGGGSDTVQATSGALAEDMFWDWDASWAWATETTWFGAVKMTWALARATSVADSWLIHAIQ